MNTEVAKKVKEIIAEVVGFDVEDIGEGDKFIPDYKITYTERKALLAQLNDAFSRAINFENFCKLDNVMAVIETYSGIRPEDEGDIEPEEDDAP